jgi:hypothetical protein
MCKGTIVRFDDRPFAVGLEEIVFLYFPTQRFALVAQFNTASSKHNISSNQHCCFR